MTPVSLTSALAIGRAWFPVVMTMVGALSFIMHAEIKLAIDPIESKLDSIAAQTTRDERQLDDVSHRLNILEGAALSLPIQQSKEEAHD